MEPWFGIATSLSRARVAARFQNQLSKSSKPSWTNGRLSGGVTGSTGTSGSITTTSQDNWTASANASGTWSYSGSGTTTAIESASLSYAGSGSFTQTMSGSGGAWLSGGGTLSESGYSNTSATYTKVFEPTGSGTWGEQSGSGSGEATWCTGWSYSGSGSYSYPSGSGTITGSTSATGGKTLDPRLPESVEKDDPELPPAQVTQWREATKDLEKAHDNIYQLSGQVQALQKSVDRQIAWLKQMTDGGGKQWHLDMQKLEKQTYGKAESNAAREKQRIQFVADSQKQLQASSQRLAKLSQELASSLTYQAVAKSNLRSLSDKSLTYLKDHGYYWEKTMADDELRRRRSERFIADFERARDLEASLMPGAMIQDINIRAEERYKREQSGGPWSYVPAVGGIREALYHLGVAARTNTPSVAYQHQMDAFVHLFLSYTDVIGAPSAAKGVKELAEVGLSKVTAKLAAKNGGMQAAAEEAKQVLQAELEVLAKAGSAEARQTLLEFKLLTEGSCFAAGTLLLTPDGEEWIECLRKGDRVLSRSQFDVDGRLEAKVVEEVFVRTASIVALLVGGRLIRTTAEHPFYVLGQGWRCVRDLREGDWLVSHERIPVRVDGIEATGEVATVYNLRVADYHTYFVGSREWGFSVWAHNALYEVAEEGGKIFLRYGEGPLKGQTVKTPAGDLITYATKEQALAKAAQFNATAAPVNPRAAVEGLADSYRGLPAAQRPLTVAQLETPTGGFGGRSSYTGGPHPVVQQLADANPGRFSGACAECDAVSQALRAAEARTGQTITTVEQARQALSGSSMQTARVRGPNSTAHGTPIPPCETCQPLLDALGIPYR